VREQWRSEDASTLVCASPRHFQQQSFTAGAVAAWLGSIVSTWASYHGKKKFSGDCEREFHQNSLLPTSHCFHVWSASKHPRAVCSSTNCRVSCSHPKQKSGEPCSSLLAPPGKAVGAVCLPGWSPRCQPGQRPLRGAVHPWTSMASPCASHLLFLGAGSSSPSLPLALRAPLLILLAGVVVVDFLSFQEPLAGWVLFPGCGLRAEGLLSWGGLSRKMCNKHPCLCAYSAMEI